MSKSFVLASSLAFVLASLVGCGGRDGADISPVNYENADAAPAPYVCPSALCVSVASHATGNVPIGVSFNAMQLTFTATQKVEVASVGFYVISPDAKTMWDAASFCESDCLHGDEFFTNAVLQNANGWTMMGPAEPILGQDLAAYVEMHDAFQLDAGQTLTLTLNIGPNWKTSASIGRRFATQLLFVTLADGQSVTITAPPVTDFVTVTKL